MTHVFVGGPIAVVNQTQTCARFAKPAVSEYLSANVWKGPLPPFGVTLSAVGTPPTLGTFHVPLSCQPLDVPFVFPASNSVVLAPMYAGLKVTGRFSVNTFPAPVTVAESSWIAHWLF